MPNPKKAPAIDWDKIEHLLTFDSPGPEWFTCREFAEHYQYKMDTADNRLRKLVKVGRLEATQLPNRKNYYRIKK